MITIDNLLKILNFVRQKYPEAIIEPTSYNHITLYKNKDAHATKPTHPLLSLSLNNSAIELTLANLFDLLPQEEVRRAKERLEDL